MLVYIFRDNEAIDEYNLERTDDAYRNFTEWLAFKGYVSSGHRIDFK